MDDKILINLLYSNLFIDPVIGPSIVFGGRSKINKKFHMGKKFIYEIFLPKIYSFHKFKTPQKGRIYL